MSLDVNATMDAIGTALGAIANLRVFDFVPDSAYPPFAFVDLPDELVYDNTMKRGTDFAIFPIFVAVGRISDRAARDELAAYLAGTGTKSVKAAVDSPGVRRVARASVDIMTVAAQDFLAATFLVEVVS